MQTLAIDQDLQAHVTKALADCSLFRALKPEHLPQLVKVAELIQYEPEDVIIKQGDPSDAFYVLVRGEAAVTTDKGAGESIEIPQRPAVRGPDGDTDAATAISMCGRVYGARCSLASRSSNQLVLRVTTSPRSSAMITSSDSAIMSRWFRGSMPSIIASDGRRPGPTPNIARPRVRWSSWTMRSATMSGWW